jgi:hypothetical protein
VYLNLNGTKTSPEQSGPKASDAKYSNFAKPANGHRQDEVFQVEKEDIERYQRLRLEANSAHDSR